MNISEVYNKQVEYFNLNETKNVSFRIKQLKKLKSLLKTNEDKLYDAIYNDFSKSSFETYISEFSLIYHEINLIIKNLSTWSSKQKVYTGLANFPASSYIIPEPLGVTLVIGAWNYPIQLSLLPALTSLAAGNTVIMKPSELTQDTSTVLTQLINENFPPEYFRVIEGGVEETQALLVHRFDKIFFTGSTAVGKIIYTAAAKHLTPVTLELGGKSPTFVLKDANIKITAKRIVWAKFFNAGQTCVAPDYILVDSSIEAKLLKAIKLEIENNHAGSNEDGIDDNYVQIINDHHFNRINDLLPEANIYYGGKTSRNNRFISPTIINKVGFDDDIMQDEIFGPILPIISFVNLDHVIKEVKSRPKPLSCYIYGKDKRQINQILNEVSFGGGAVNDSMMHLSNSNLPFGGVGHSGMGNYHGKAGFDNFSHFKSILHKVSWLELPIKYKPYQPFKLKLIKWLLE